MMLNYGYSFTIINYSTPHLFLTCFTNSNSKYFLTRLGIAGTLLSFLIIKY